MYTALTEYFSGPWLACDRSLDQYELTGWALVDKIKPHERVLDVGCGENLFKPKIKNLHGIDITDVGADEVVSIEDFQADEKFDVAFCLGSINFGDINVIRIQIEKVVAALKPSNRIYWRCNPGKKDHGNEECKDIDFFPWSYGHQRYFADCHGYSIRDMRMDGKRIYAEWIKY